MDNYVPSVVLDGPVNSGLYGRVYKGKQLALDRTVAVKIIKPDMAQRADIIAHAKALARITHPNVVAVFEVTTVQVDGIDGVVQAIVMEWLEGENLGLRLRGPRFIREEVRIVSHGIVSGMSHMHSCDMAHGDLHLGNIIILADATPKIIDIDATKERSLGRLSTISREAAVNLDIDYCKGAIFRVLCHSEVPLNAVNDAELEIEAAKDLNSLARFSDIS